MKYISSTKKQIDLLSSSMFSRFTHSVFNDRVHNEISEIANVSEATDKLKQDLSDMTTAIIGKSTRQFHQFMDILRQTFINIISPKYHQNIKNC